jgi:cephalosporin hydroxylase
VDFEKERNERIIAAGSNADLHREAAKFMVSSISAKYSYNFSWLGRPIIQYPQDIVAMQEIIWATRPDLIIETGIAHGGSLIFSASMLELNAACGGPAGAAVIGVDIDIRKPNRLAIEDHPMSKRIKMIEGSSIAPDVISQVHSAANGKQAILICLDSNHTRDHVLAELEAYAPLCTVGSYCVVFDTIVERVPKSLYPDRPWGPSDNPTTAVREYLATHPEFQIDRLIDNKLGISVSPEGYLKRIK